MPRFQDLAEGQLLKFSDISGLEGFPNLFKKVGNEVIPYLGADTGAVQLDQSARNFGGSVRPLSYAEGSKLTNVTAQGSGGGIKLWQDASGKLFNDPSGSSPYHQTAEQLTSQGYQIQGGKSYAEDLNDITTPRAIDGQIVSGSQALAQQAQERQAYTSVPTGASMGYNPAGLTPEQLAYQNTFNSPSYSSKPVQPNFIGGLSTAQKQSITNLLANRPSSQWSATDIKNWNYATGGQALPSGFPKTKPVEGITSDGLKKATSINLPNIEYTPSNDSMTEIERATALIENKRKAIEATKTATQTQDENLLLKEMGQIAGLEGKSAYKTQLEQQKLDPLEAQLDTLSAELASLKGEKSRLLAEQQGKPITMASIIGAQAQINAVMDSKIYAVSAMVDALDGNITRAEKSIQRAVDAKYAPLEEKLAITKAQREAIASELTKDDKIQSDALDELGKQKVQALADKKAEEKSEKAVILDLIGKYSDAGITFDDTLIQAQAKLKGSKIYQEQVRPPVGSVKQTPEEKQIEAFKKEAGDLVTKLVTKEYTWGQAYDILKTKYPQATPDTINATLGGGIPYDQKTGKFDTSKAWGLAKQ